MISDVEKLAADMIGAEVDNELYEKFERRFGVDFCTFSNIVEALVPYTVTFEDEGTKKLFRGFVKGNTFIVKVPVKKRIGK
jgi:hypothetical protein